MLMVSRNIIEGPYNILPPGFTSYGTILHTAIMTTLRQTWICVNKEFCTYRSHGVNQCINFRYFLMHVIKVKVIWQSNMTIDMQFITITLGTQVVDIYPGIMSVCI